MVISVIFLQEEAYTLFMASNNWYLFLRLHAILCERLAKIYERSVILANEETKNRTSRKESTAVALRLKPKPTIDVEEYYPAFLDMVKNLLDGNMEATAFEDTLREMFGIHAYIAFTFDKVVSYAVRQLQHCVTEKTAIACMDWFLREQKKGGTGGPCFSAHRRLHHELAYERAVEKMIGDESCYKIFIYKRDCRMTIEMIDTESEEPKKTDESKKWSSYKGRYQDLTNSDLKHPSLPLYLSRNLRNGMKKRGRRRSCVSLNKDKTEINRGEGCTDDKTEGDVDRTENFPRKIPERNQTNHPGYTVNDKQECTFNPSDFKILFTTNKDSFIYKNRALKNARMVRYYI